MMSLITVGEYDDMKSLVRDGSKKLREASELADDALLSINRGRRGFGTASSNVSSRKRVSPNYVARQRAAEGLVPSRLPQSAPPKLKGNPRDRPSTRKLDD